ncbi:hypothetical protein C8J57DRAFT_1487053 [Mycena rebaudengoi]|nr:hypothetical protein C8J57DRAFT_1487053 [Mycena rebaudengoi]
MQLSTSNHSLAWICALKTISVSVPGSNHPHKYFCGCLDPQTEKDIDFGAWIQPPAQIFLWVLDLDTESNFIFGAWIQPPPQIFMWVLGSAHRNRLQEYFSGSDPGTQISIASGAWNQLPSKVFLRVLGSRHRKPFVFSAWTQTPARILPQWWVFGSRHPQKYFRCARIYPPNINIAAGVWIQSLAAILLQCMDPGTHKKITMGAWIHSPTVLAGILERLRAWLIAGFSDQSSSMIHEEFNGYSHSDADDDSCYEGLR